MSGGDGMGGLLLLILVAMILIIAVAALVPFLLTLFLGKKFKSQNTRMIAALGAGALGVVIGVLIVTATFFESTWSPTDEITFNVPANFSHTSIYLIEDSRVTREIDWHGSNRVPFMHRSATLDVSASGVVRVRSLVMGDIIQMPHAKTQHGKTANGSGLRMAPPALSNGLMFRFDFGDVGSAPANVDSNDDALVQYVLDREATR